MKPAATLLIALALATTAPAIAQQSSPITFARGASSATVAGTIRGREYRDYTVRAAAGQRMRVTMNTRSGSAYFNVMPPGSDGFAVFVGSSSGYTYDGLLDRGGPWTIRVYQMRNAGRRGAVANYRLNVAVTGRPAAPRPYDAQVPGTGYNATAPIDCRIGINAPMRRCEAGVRRLGNGNAVVEITTGPGSLRRIEFRDGLPVSSNIGPVQASKGGDMFFVNIGGEMYRIPEILLTGG